MKQKAILKKQIVWYGLLILIFSCIFGAVLFLRTQERKIGENPIAGMNEKRSVVLVTGENYTLNYDQEQKYLQEQKQKEQDIEKQDHIPLSKELKTEKTRSPVIKETISETNVKESGVSEENTGTNEETDVADSPGGENNAENESGGGDGFGDGDDGDNTGGNDDFSKLPVITCSLTEGQEISGAFLGFTVEAVSYKHEQINSFGLKVTVNGNKLYSSGEQNGVISYRTSQELQEGNNEITITATDKEGYTSTKTYHILVNLTGNRPEGGTMRVLLRADVLGLGTLLDETVTFYEGENLPYVIDRAFQQADLTYSHSGTFDYGFYLQRIYQPGITNGYQIPLPIQQKLEEENCSWMGYETDSLGEKDFYEWAGWMYRLDGYFPDGFSTIPAEDGSEIEILFTLNNGAEYNGNWFDGNW